MLPCCMRMFGIFVNRVLVSLSFTFLLSGYHLNVLVITFYYVVTNYIPGRSLLFGG